MVTNQIILCLYLLVELDHDRTSAQVKNKKIKKWGGGVLISKIIRDLFGVKK